MYRCLLIIFLFWITGCRKVSETFEPIEDAIIYSAN